MRDCGAQVVGPALSLDEAVALLETNEIDAAVLDVNLLGQSAMPLADLCAQRGIPFVFTTGYDRSDLDGHAGAPRFQKPVDCLLTLHEPCWP